MHAQNLCDISECLKKSFSKLWDGAGSNVQSNANQAGKCLQISDCSVAPHLYTFDKIQTHRQNEASEVTYLYMRNTVTCLISTYQNTVRNRRIVLFVFLNKKGTSHICGQIRI